MAKAYYASSIRDFLDSTPITIHGHILIQDEMKATTEQKNAWRDEIAILQKQLRALPGDGSIIFEYTVPRIGSRIDVACIVHGIIFVLEFKVNETEYRLDDEEQVIDYALDLKYFHEESEKRYIVPILIATKAPASVNRINIFDDKILDVLYANENNIGDTIQSVLNVISDTDDLSCNAWVNSKYRPTPTIIEAAQALYQNHDVSEISRSDAGAENLSKTNAAINGIIDRCKT